MKYIIMLLLLVNSCFAQELALPLFVELNRSQAMTCENSFKSNVYTVNLAFIYMGVTMEGGSNSFVEDYGEYDQYDYSEVMSLDYFHENIDHYYTPKHLFVTRLGIVLPGVKAHNISVFPTIGVSSADLFQRSVYTHYDNYHILSPSGYYYQVYPSGKLAGGTFGKLEYGAILHIGAIDHWGLSVSYNKMTYINMKYMSFGIYVDPFEFSDWLLGK